MSGKAKGNAFERLICTQLSLWWSKGTREDLFWRTSNSGGRATVRGQKNKTTNNAEGDIGATDPLGYPLLKVMVWELKRGYSTHTIANLLDKPEKAKEQEYEKWIAQAKQSQKNAKSFYWIILHKRDRRDAFIYMPDDLYGSLIVQGAFQKDGAPYPFITLELDCDTSIVGIKFDHFLTGVNPDHVNRLLVERQGVKDAPIVSDEI